MLADMEAHQREWMLLQDCPGLTRGAWKEALQQAGSRSALLRRCRQQHPALESGLEPLLERTAAWLQAGPDRHLLTPDDADYPELLRRIPDPPMTLYVLGDPGWLWHPQVAVIGSRNPTRGGRDTTRDFSTTLARSGMVITSGMALGVDGCAHQAALDADCPTVAVVATGLDHCYPARHRGLMQQIATQGAVVSEYPLGTPPHRSRFPVRNRIISGLSLGVLVVEAGLRSGTLATARHALAQGREVFAIPGSIHNPMAKGCHLLIKQGARLVETAAEMLEELSGLAAELAASLRGRLATETAADADTRRAEVADDEYARLLEAMGHDPVGIDDLSRITGLTAEALSSMLLIMELDGRVETLQGGLYSRTR